MANAPLIEAKSEPKRSFLFIAETPLPSFRTSGDAMRFTVRVLVNPKDN